MDSGRRRQAPAYPFLLALRHPSEEPPGRPELRRRVCTRCGMGMVLTCPRDALPGEAAAFLIIDYELNVSAVSEGGERFFGPRRS